MAQIARPGPSRVKSRALIKHPSSPLSGGLISPLVALKRTALVPLPRSLGPADEHDSLLTVDWTPDGHIDAPEDGLPLAPDKEPEPTCGCCTGGDSPWWQQPVPCNHDCHYHPNLPYPQETPNDQSHPTIIRCSA